MDEINWLKTVWNPSRGNRMLDDADIFSAYVQKLMAQNIQITSVLPGYTDTRNLMEKLDDLQTTDRISLNSVVVYEPSITSTLETIQSLKRAENAYREQRGEIAFDLASAGLASVWNTAQVVYDSAGRLIQDLPTSRLERSLAPPEGGGNTFTNTHNQACQTLDKPTTRLQSRPFI